MAGYFTGLWNHLPRGRQSCRLVTNNEKMGSFVHTCGNPLFLWRLLTNNEKKGDSAIWTNSHSAQPRRTGALQASHSHHYHECRKHRLTRTRCSSKGNSAKQAVLPFNRQTSVLDLFQRVRGLFNVLGAGQDLNSHLIRIRKDQGGSDPCL